MSSNRRSSIPAVDAVLREPPVLRLLQQVPRRLLVEIVREALEEIRERLPLYPEKFADRRMIINEAVALVEQRAAARGSRSLKPVINATGVVLHTNLGRARLGEAARNAVLEVAGSYSNLEFNLATGSRGTRYSHVVELLTLLTGAEEALVVNNNAAAVLLALSTLAAGKEVIVSRGQMVEIGDSFRVPEVMQQSGARLVEVGTTNRTHLRDYQQAISERTALLLKVHTSNFRIVGFTHETPIAELVQLGRERGIPVMEDLGSGLLVDLQPWGLPHEPVVKESVAAGADVVSFSADKLLGGPQAGIIVGRREAIAPMKKNPLLRALRIDKLTLAALEATLREYLDLQQALRSLPTLRMLTVPLPELKERAEDLASRLQQLAPAGLKITIAADRSTVGGGAMPAHELPTWTVTLRPEKSAAKYLSDVMRLQSPPVVARVQDDRVVLDVRTIAPEEAAAAAASIAQAAKSVEQQKE